MRRQRGADNNITTSCGFREVQESHFLLQNLKIICAQRSYHYHVISGALRSERLTKADGQCSKDVGQVQQDMEFWTAGLLVVSVGS